MEKTSFLCPTQGHDLFEAELDECWDGGTILNTYGTGTMYIRLSQPTLMVQPVKPRPVTAMVLSSSPGILPGQFNFSA